MGVGARGSEFQNVVDAYGLEITNTSDTPWEDQWTFESSMGERRKLDYIMVSRSFHLVSSTASNQINLGSEHRAVKSIIVAGTCRHHNTRKNVSMKNWVPKLDVQGDSSEYQNALDVRLEGTPPKTFDEIAVIMRDAGEICGASIKKSRVEKPWKSDALKSLLLQRRMSESQMEKKEISKAIQKLSRRLSRKYQTDKY